MSYSVRHSVFVSSTFTDLKEERAEVIQAIWEMDCIPTGMEAFVASNESQWDVIQKVIDECDYYVLIIGGRYGSIAGAEGISYTEKEYRYAKKAGLPVLAFVHAAPEEIPIGKSDLDEQLRAKLTAFRQEVMTAHPIREWRTAAELGAVVSRSLTREIKVSPRPGWIRNDGSSPIALLEQINRLTEENRQLREVAQATNATEEVDDGLESGEDEVILFGTRAVQNPLTYRRSEDEWQVSASWNAIWRDLGPALINETAETDMQAKLARFELLAEQPQSEFKVLDVTIALESWSEVLIQLRALGFIVPGEKKRGVNDRASYWRITPRGDRHLVNLLARRKTAEQD